MDENLRTRLGAVVLALLTIAAIVFAVLNFQQRSRFILPDDGVTWMDSDQGVVALHVIPGSPGIRQGSNREIGSNRSGKPRFTGPPTSRAFCGG